MTLAGVSEMGVGTVYDFGVAGSCVWACPEITRPLWRDQSVLSQGRACAGIEGSHGTQLVMFGACGAISQ